MKTPMEGVRGGQRPRREKPMLDRAVEYAKLHNGGKGMKASDMALKFKENEVTIYKLIRLGEAPRPVIAMIRKGDISATVVANSLKASMTPKEVIQLVEGLVKERAEIRSKLNEAGFKGGSSMTLRRAFTLAIDNLKKRHLLKGEGRKAIVRALSSIMQDEKPTVESIESAILMN